MRVLRRCIGSVLTNDSGGDGGFDVGQPGIASGAANGGGPGSTSAGTEGSGGQGAGDGVAGSGGDGADSVKCVAPTSEIILSVQPRVGTRWWGCERPFSSAALIRQGGGGLFGGGGLSFSARCADLHRRWLSGSARCHHGTGRVRRRRVVLIGFALRPRHHQQRHDAARAADHRHLLGRRGAVAYLAPPQPLRGSSGRPRSSCCPSSVPLTVTSANILFAVCPSYPSVSCIVFSLSTGRG